MKANDLQQPMKMGSGCLIISKSTGKWLLIRRSSYVPMPLTWGLPGGRVDPGERPSDAARRETMEETGIDIHDREMRLIYVNDAHAPRFRFYTYACVIENEVEPMLNWESDGYIWCGVDDLPQPLHWGVSQLMNHDRSARILRRFMRGSKVSI